MAQAYERMGLLNDSSHPDNVMVSPWQILLGAFEHPVYSMRMTP